MIINNIPITVTTDEERFGLSAQERRSAGPDVSAQAREARAAGRERSAVAEQRQPKHNEGDQ